MKLLVNCNFLGGWREVQNKKTFHGEGGEGVWIVSGTAHSHTNSLQDTDTNSNILSAQYCHYFVEHKTNLWLRDKFLSEIEIQKNFMLASLL